MLCSLWKKKKTGWILQCFWWQRRLKNRRYCSRNVSFVRYKLSRERDCLVFDELLDGRAAMPSWRPKKPEDFFFFSFLLPFLLLFNFVWRLQLFFQNIYNRAFLRLIFVWENNGTNVKSNKHIVIIAIYIVNIYKYTPQLLLNDGCTMENVNMEHGHQTWKS